VGSDIGIRIISGIIHIQMKSTCIRTVTPITAENSDTRSIQISIIFFTLVQFILDVANNIT
jgi:hypothetical protein